MSDDYDTNVDAKVEDRINAGNSGDEVRGNEISKSASVNSGRFLLLSCH